MNFVSPPTLSPSITERNIPHFTDFSPGSTHFLFYHITHGKLLCFIDYHSILHFVAGFSRFRYSLYFMNTLFCCSHFSSCSFELACAFVCFCFLDHFLIFWHHDMCSLFWPCNQMSLQGVLVPLVIKLLRNQDVKTRSGLKFALVVGMYILWIGHFTPCDVRVLEKLFAYVLVES